MSILLHFRSTMSEAKKRRLRGKQDFSYEPLILEPILVDDDDDDDENGFERMAIDDKPTGEPEIEGEDGSKDKTEDKAKEIAQHESQDESQDEAQDDANSETKEDASESEILEDNVTPSFLSFNEDCFGEIFNWLSSTDIKSISATCKKLHEVAAKHFSRKYPGKCLKIRPPTAYTRAVPGTKAGGFIKFYRNVYLEDADREIFDFVAERCRQPLNKIQFGQQTVRKRIVSGLGVCIKDQLNSVAAIEFIGCKIDGELHALILRYCAELQRLSIRIYAHEGTYIGTSDKWLLKKYPNLVHLAMVKKPSKINELKTFFVRNTKTKSFTTSLAIVMLNKMTFRDKSVTLNDLAVELPFEENAEKQLEKFLHFANKLNKNGRFKRLHLRFIDASTLIDNINEIAALKGLVGIYLDCEVKISEVFVEALAALNELETLYIRQPIFEGTDTGILWKGALNVKQLFIQTMKSGDFSTEILAFIQQSSKVWKIYIRKINGNDLNLDLAKAYKERNKLYYPRKVNVLIDEDSYMHIRWSNEKTMFDTIEVKRAESDSTNHPFMLHDE